MATVALLIPWRLGGWARESPDLAPAIEAARLLIPLLGFAAAGAIGGTALERGRRGLAAFGSGFLATGLAIWFVAPLLQNLTGFESRALVASFAAAGTGGAFACAGLVAGLLLEPRRAPALAAGFAAGGALGGLVTVTPALLSDLLGGLPAEVLFFFRLFCSLVGLLLPFAVAGAVAGRVLEGMGATTNAE